MLWPKKHSYKEFDNEKQFLRLKNSPPPPHNFCNGPSLTSEILCFHCLAIKNKKNANHSMQKCRIWKMKEDKYPVCKKSSKKFRSVRNFIALNARYLGKSFTQIYKALYGDAMLVSL